MVSQKDSMNKTSLFCFCLKIALRNALTDECRTTQTSFKIVNWNSFDVTCKNKRAISTHCINFTAPLSLKISAFDREINKTKRSTKSDYQHLFIIPYEIYQKF